MQISNIEEDLFTSVTNKKATYLQNKNAQWNMIKNILELLTGIALAFLIINPDC